MKIKSLSLAVLQTLIQIQQCIEHRQRIWRNWTFGQHLAALNAACLCVCEGMWVYFTTLGVWSKNAACINLKLILLEMLQFLADKIVGCWLLLCCLVQVFLVKLHYKLSILWFCFYLKAIDFQVESLDAAFTAATINAFVVQFLLV